MKKSAFSLIEISIVVLIIGIFLAAITSGRLLIKKAKNVELTKRVEEALQSQEYYQYQSLDITVSALEATCGSNPSQNTIIDYFNTGKCCVTSDLASLCCTAASGCECSTNNRCLTP